MTRDRDPSGRPRSARARDELGRPLPRSRGTAAPQEEPVLPPDEALRSAQSLLDGGQAFHAHEVLEAVWKSATEDRDLWRGLAQVAVAVTHRQRGNDAGAAALRERAAATLQPWAGRTPYGVDVDGLRAWCAGRSGTEVPRLAGGG